MVAGKALHQHAGKLRLPVEEDALVGDKHVVEHGEGLHAAELAVAHVHLAALPLAGVAALPPDDHEQPLGVQRHGKGDGIIPVVGAHGLGGHDNDLVAVDDAGLVRLGAAHHHAVLPALHHPQEQVGVSLGVGGLGAVPLGVGHGPVHRQVVLLTVQHKLFEVLVVVGAVLLVDLIGGGILGVERIHPHAALEAGGRLLAQKALHLHLIAQILGGAVDVGEAVDAPAGLGGDGGHQLLVLGHLGQVVGHAHGVEGGAEDGVVHRVFHLLAEHIDLHRNFADAFNVLLAGHERHDSKLPFYAVAATEACSHGYNHAGNNAGS